MQSISWSNLLWCITPLLLLLTIYWYWLKSTSELIIAFIRMLIQLVAVGYFLIIIFNQPSLWISLCVLLVMCVSATWISIRPIPFKRHIFIAAGSSLVISVGFHLWISLYLILQLDTWYEPRVLIPLAGMYFANTMTTISLTAERFYAELESKKSIELAKSSAFNTAMIPQINGLLAVGLVALPGMMTGQILSGVSPLVAVRYQIMIMSMLLGTCGIGSALFLYQLCRLEKNNS